MPQPLGNNRPELMLTPVNEILQAFAILKPQTLSSQQMAYLHPFMCETAIAQYAALEKMALARHFVLLPLVEIALENAKRDLPLAGLTRQWLLFASSIQGDAWLIKRQSTHTEVAFVKGSEGKAAIPQTLGIRFEQWLQLAFLMQQIEMCMISPSAAEVLAALNCLHPALSQHYPYPLDH